MCKQGRFIYINWFLVQFASIVDDWREPYLSDLKSHFLQYRHQTRKVIFIVMGPDHEIEIRMLGVLMQEFH